MLILGVNAFHGDASAALVRDGEIVCAVEEERFRRIKHWAGLPTESIKYCLSQVGANLADIDILAVNQDASANMAKKLAFLVKERPSLDLVMDRFRNRQKRRSIDLLVSEALGSRFKGKVEQIEHHVAHLASAYYCSPFTEAVVVSLDGFGDFASTAWGIGAEETLNVEGRVYFPHSLGIFYQAITQLIGFPNYGDEYKMMGLAPYGKPKYMHQMRQVVQVKETGVFELDLQYFRHQSERLDNWAEGVPSVGKLFTDAMEGLLGPKRTDGDPLSQHHMDIARSAQAMYEEAAFAILNVRYDKHLLKNVALAGGCAQNSVANGRIYANTNFRQIYVHAAAGDAGGAIGAAAAAWYSQGQAKRPDCAMPHAYLGPQHTDAAIEELLSTRLAQIVAAGCTVERLSEESTLVDQTAAALAKGEVVGWFQGRMEWGPRALGNRSILGDPREPMMKEILNNKIKRRESFRPFAPSVLRERVSDWFDVDDDVPFMMQVYPIREDKRETVPAVTHLDGSGRLQTVREVDNALYYRLIVAFERLTGVPMLLNTSFNENEPIVCRPEEALDCFLRTRMDLLVLGSWFIQRGRADPGVLRETCEAKVSQTAEHFAQAN